MHQTGGLVFKILTTETVYCCHFYVCFRNCSLTALGPDAIFLTAVSLLNIANTA